MSERSTIKAIVMDAAKQHFADNVIHDVVVHAADSAEDDDFMDIRVIYDASEGRLRADATSSFTGFLRARLHERGEARFPVISYVSQAEALAE